MKFFFSPTKETIIVPSKSHNNTTVATSTNCRFCGHFWKLALQSKLPTTAHAFSESSRIQKCALHPLTNFSCTGRAESSIILMLTKIETKKVLKKLEQLTRKPS